MIFITFSLGCKIGFQVACVISGIVIKLWNENFLLAKRKLQLGGVRMCFKMFDKVAGVLPQPKIVLMATLLSFSGSVHAQDIKFGFVNPSFGGNPFNSGHLLGLAEIQNTHEAPRPSSATGNSQTDLFVRQLQSRILSSLSSGLAESITGADVGDTDTVTLGDQEIFYERTADSIVVVISDVLNGSSTRIELPVLESSLGDGS